MQKKYQIIATLLFIFLGGSPVFSQFKDIKLSEKTNEKIMVKPEFLPSINQNYEGESYDFSKKKPLFTSSIKHSIFPAAYDNGEIIAYKGYLDEQIGKSVEEQTGIYLQFLGEKAELREEIEYAILDIQEDKFGQQHISVQQTISGIEIEGGEIKLHEKNGVISFMNGRIKDVSSVSTEGIINSEKALEVVYDDYRTKGIFKEIKESQKFLVPEITEKVDLVLREINDTYRLVYRVKAYANIQQEFTYYLDANSGNVLESFKNFCTLHDHSSLPPDGPATATATDLGNVNRTINTYEVSNTFYMIDASRSMFSSSQSSLPNDPVGVIWTIDGQNTNPQNDNFDYDHVKSTDNNWASKISVSAHYNGGEAYEYFKEVHDRNSINNEGGNIISLINISDPYSGGGYDNAFWNGAALFYGNGSQAFTPLAEGLDVAGHEMSHGVIQATANLTYQGESGALNEAFADIFGAMIDRDDWFIGEEIVKTSVFPTGKMRDMSNPNNGGSQFGDTGWQPDNVSEQYTGSQDNGGVHINSGIINHAYYIFAETNGVGKDRAEQIFYRALTMYLSKSSNFKDMRVAAEQATQDFIDAGTYNASVLTAVSAAFSSVGIGEGGGSTDYETDVEMNPGEDFLLSSSSNLGEVFLRNNNLELIGDPLIAVSHISKPSVTDNGEAIYFVGDDKRIYVVNINWETGEVSGDVFDNQTVWRNVVVSKDGSKLAILTDQTSNEIIVFNMVTGSQQSFELFNPTFSQDGAVTGDVDFADFMEFDFTGEWLMYDAQSTISGGSNGEISYWDIGFVNVFNNSQNNFADGEIQKLFNLLPENTSVGNPTFSKNSPYIIAFDLIEEDGYSVMGANIEANEVNTIYANNKLGYPNFNNADGQIVYETGGFISDNISLSELEDDKITAEFGTHVDIVSSERLPVIFSNGERDLVSTEDENFEVEVSLSPNPVSGLLLVEWDSSYKMEKMEIFALDGKRVRSLAVGGSSTMTIDVSGFNSGAYTLILRGSAGNAVKQFVKE